MYSSIEKSSRLEVINKCYWPLLKLSETAPIGIEAPALTLEIINDIAPAWINKLAELIKLSKVEFIGSGYSQIIGPLVPAKVNNWNQQIGLGKYNDLLGVKPKLALVNEMAYSGGIGEHYINAGYSGIIMEWNNPRSAHPEWENEWRYFPQKAIASNCETIPLIWADSIAFQKFQRYAHGEYELDEYSEYIKSHIGDSDRYFPLYSNDVEIFDYRPGRYKTEAQFANHSDWDKLIELYSHLKQKDWCDFVFPSEVLNHLNNENGANELKLETPAQPIPVKKQEKYNINRWALTGRDDVGINSSCYKIYNFFVETNNTKPKDWTELCYLWSSDFRTHITEKRWNDYIERMEILLGKCGSKNIAAEKNISNNVELSESEKWINVEDNNYKIVLNKHKGLTIQSLVIKKYGNESLLGTLNHGYFDDISLGADYYSGHAIIERPGEHKITDLGKVDTEISESGSRVSIKTKQKWDDYYIKNKIMFENEKLIFKKIINNKSDEKAIIRPFNFTINPEAWDRNSMFIATHNGASILEKFHLRGQNISHRDIYSSLISARHGFGNTEGIFIVGDKDKTIIFECDMSSCALIPSIVYKELNNSSFFRLQYSAREMDETMKMYYSDRVNSTLNIRGKFDE